MKVPQSNGYERTPITLFFNFGLPWCSCFTKTSAKTGLITRATNSDDISVTITVMGMYDIKSPVIPGQKSNGKKAATVVNVEDATGHATSAVAFFAASILL